MSLTGHGQERLPHATRKWASVSQQRAQLLFECGGTADDAWKRLKTEGAEEQKEMMKGKG